MQFGRGIVERLTTGNQEHPSRGGDGLLSRGGPPPTTSRFSHNLQADWLSPSSWVHSQENSPSGAGETEVQTLCVRCARVLEFSGERPRFCGYCAHPLPPGPDATAPPTPDPGATVAAP